MSFVLLIVAALLLYMVLAMMFLAFVGRLTSNKRILSVAKVFSILVPVYLLAVWWVEADNYNTMGSGAQWTKELHEQCRDFDINGHVVALEKNPLAFEMKDIYVSNKSVFEYPECLGLFLESIYLSKHEIEFRIYEEIDDGHVNNGPVGKHLIMKINKKAN